MGEELLKVIPFRFEDRDYEIRVGKFPEGIRVRAFLGAEPANPWEYRVDYITAGDFARQTGELAWAHLVAAAKADVESKRLEKVQEGRAKG